MKTTPRIARAALVIVIGAIGAFEAIGARTQIATQGPLSDPQPVPSDGKQPVPSPAPQTAPASAPQPAPPAPVTGTPSPAALSSSAASQTDEGAGKGADIEKIGHSPANGSPYLGAKDPLVVVNVFSDFQCPVCRRSADPIKQLIMDFPDGAVKVYFRHNALPMHQRALPAALASLAAGKQGKFWPYHDRLFANQRGLDDASLKQVAQDLGLDMVRWEKDIADPVNVARIKEESAAAMKVGAPGTPGLFVNGWRERGWGSYGGLKAAVQRELAKGNALVAAGEPRAGIPAARIRAMANTNSKAPDEGEIDPEVWVKILTAD